MFCRWLACDRAKEARTVTNFTQLMEKAAFDAIQVNGNNHIGESEAGLVIMYKASNVHSRHIHSFLAPKVAASNLKVQRKIGFRGGCVDLAESASIAVKVLQVV